MLEFDLPPAIADLVAARNKLRAHYASAGLKFTLDGNLVGDLGEAIAVELFGLQLVEARSTAGIDGRAPDGRTVQVKASMPNQDLTLWPGQFVDVVLDAGVMPKMVSIPTVAVQPGQKGSFVYVVGPNSKVQERPVEIALVHGDNSAVSKGVKSGERVVTYGQTRLKQGTLVRDETAKTAGTSRKVADNLAGDFGAR